jgi:hypothetical protein
MKSIIWAIPVKLHLLSFCEKSRRHCEVTHTLCQNKKHSNNHYVTQSPGFVGRAVVKITDKIWGEPQGKPRVAMQLPAQGELLHVPATYNAARQLNCSRKRRTGRHAGRAIARRDCRYNVRLVNAAPPGKP